MVRKSKVDEEEIKKVDESEEDLEDLLDSEEEDSEEEISIGDIGLATARPSEGVWITKDLEDFVEDATPEIEVDIVENSDNQEGTYEALEKREDEETDGRDLYGSKDGSDFYGQGSEGDGFYNSESGERLYSSPDVKPYGVAPESDLQDIRSHVQKEKFWSDTRLEGMARKENSRLQKMDVVLPEGYKKDKRKEVKYTN